MTPAMTNVLSNFFDVSLDLDGKVATSAVADVMGGKIVGCTFIICSK